MFFGCDFVDFLVTFSVRFLSFPHVFCQFRLPVAEKNYPISVPSGSLFQLHFGFRSVFDYFGRVDDHFGRVDFPVISFSKQIQSKPTIPRSDQKNAQFHVLGPLLA